MRLGVIKVTVGYIPAGPTIAAARRDGLSVCEYVERLWRQEGQTQKVIDQMAACRVFGPDNPKILEIGPGTGRYLEKVLRVCRPARYEVYETDRDWAKYVRTTYPVVAHTADGWSLSQTPSDSVDIVHSHGVFTLLPFFVAYRYWTEMWRVVRPSGTVVFDIVSETCLDEATVGKWLATDWTYICFLSRDYVVSLFRAHGFSLMSSFKNRLGEGQSEYLVFVRNKPAQGAT